MEHKGTVVIETPRLLLRPFMAEDAAPMFRNWESDSNVTKFLRWPTAREETEAQAVLAE